MITLTDQQVDDIYKELTRTQDPRATAGHSLHGFYPTRPVCREIPRSFTLTRVGNHASSVAPRPTTVYSAGSFLRLGPLGLPSFLDEYVLTLTGVTSYDLLLPSSTTNLAEPVLQSGQRFLQASVCVGGWVGGRLCVVKPAIAVIPQGRSFGLCLCRSGCRFLCAVSGCCMVTSHQAKRHPVRWSPAFAFAHLETGRMYWFQWPG